MVPVGKGFVVRSNDSGGDQVLRFSAPFRRTFAFAMLCSLLVGCGSNETSAVKSTVSPEVDRVLEWHRKQEKRKFEDALNKAVEATEVSKHVNRMVGELQQHHPDVVNDILRFSDQLQQDNRHFGGHLSRDNLFFADLVAFAWDRPDAFRRAAGPGYEEYRKHNQGRPYEFVYWHNARGYWEKLKANGYKHLSDQPLDQEESKTPPATGAEPTR
jgi:hypothetical protein